MYHQHYGLRDSPFAVTPDARYLFPSDPHREALAAITYGIEDRKGFVLVLGEVGTGKTTVVRRILDSLGSHTRAIYLFNVRLNFEELLRTIVRELGLACPSGDRLDMVDVLNEFLLRESMAGRTVVLVLDEAQHLAPEVLEELRMLTNLETAHEKLLQIILVGQPELGRTLAQPSLRQLRQRIALVAELRPLTSSETRAYVDHRLAVAGAKGRTVFTARAVRQLHRVSRGIPRIINVVADKALMLGYGARMKRVTAKLVREAARDQVRLNAGAARPTRWPAVAAAVTAAGVAAIAAALAASPQAREVAVQAIDAVLGPRPAPHAVTPSLAPPPAPVAAVAPASVPVSPVSMARREEPPAAPAAPAPEPAVEVSALPALPPRPEPPRPLPAPATPSAATARAAAANAATTVRTGDTLAVLIQRVYGRVDLTLLDLVKAANPSVSDIDIIVPGETVTFPNLEPTSMVHRTTSGAYAVTVLTAPSATSPEVDQVRARVKGRSLTLDLVPVRLARDLTAVRVVVEGFGDRAEAAAFYRAVTTVGATVTRPAGRRS
jgi:general secretion pathway protein A